MKIYNYLFYNSYLLTQRSKNFEDVPAFGGTLFVAACLMFNFFTIIFLLEAWGISLKLDFKKEYEYIISLVLLVFLLFYYIYKGRYKRIIEKFVQNEKGTKLHPVLVILLYYVLSFGLLLLAAMYKNHDGIFGQ